MLYSFLYFIATMPIILPVWEEGPMPPQFLKYDNIGYKAESENISLQKDGLKVSDPLFKMQVLRRLALLESEEAANVMYDFLKTESDPTLRAATLSYLYNCPPIDSQISLVEGLMNNQTEEGIAAGKLYCKFSQAKAGKVLKLLKGSSTSSKVALVQAMRENKTLKAEQWIKILNDDNSNSFQSVVFSAIAEGEVNSSTLSLLRKTLSSGSVIQKNAIAGSLVKNEQTSPIFMQMSNDKHATVRRSAANGMGLVKDSNFEDRLISLSQDKDAEVRKQAAISLRHYSSDKAVTALVKNLNDPQLLTQKAAVESLLYLSKNMEIMGLVASSLNAGNFSSRRWAAHIAGKLKKTQHAKLIEEQLRKEPNFDARSEQIYALGQFKHKIDKNFITKLSKDHERVRAQLMIYLAKIDVEEFFPFMHEAAMKDEVGFVRWAALEGAGINGSPWFNKTLADIMLDLDEENMRDAQDRATACWAAGKIRGLGKRMSDQMKLSMNRPTIPVPMGPKTYDHSSVLISIIFAYIDQSKSNNPEAELFGKYAKAFVFRFVKDTRSVDFPRGTHNDFYATQAEKYLLNQKVEPEDFPKRRLSFEFKKVREKP